MKLLFILSLIFTTTAFSQGPNRQYRDVFHQLLKNHQKIDRNIEFLDNGVKTLTTSHDSNIVFYLQKHVEQMKRLVESGRRIRNWDPLFTAIFDQYQLIDMQIKKVTDGIEVMETSYDPYVAQLIKEHAKVVSLFVKFGFEEAHRSHPIP